MKTIINTQEELDNLPLDITVEVIIVGGDLEIPLILSKQYKDAYVILSGNAVIVMRGSSQVNVMRESSQVKEMWGSSQVKEMWGSSIAKVRSFDCKITCYGYNYVFVEENLNPNIILNDTSVTLPFKTFNSTPTLDFYLKNYNINEIDGSIIMYKAVHKINDEYVSDYDREFKYLVNEEIVHELNDDINNSCSIGIHASTLDFALRFGSGWNDIAILEVKIPKDKIIVSKDCDGKIRTSHLTVLREVPKEEYVKSFFQWTQAE